MLTLSVFLVLLVAMQASNGPAGEPIKLAGSEWCKAGLEPVFVDAVALRFNDLLSREGVSVVTPRDIAAVLGIERQKQLLGCSSDGSASCLAEVGGALGVDGVLSGCIVKAGSGYTATLRAVSTKDARPLVSFSERLASEDTLQDWLDAKAKSMAQQLKYQLRPELSAAGDAPAASVSARYSLRPMTWLPVIVAGIGAILAAVGGVGTGLVLSELNSEISTQHQVTPRAASLAGQGQTLQTLGWVGGGVAAVGVLGALLFYFLPSGSSATAVAGLASSGGTSTVVLRLP